MPYIIGFFIYKLHLLDEPLSGAGVINVHMAYSFLMCDKDLCVPDDVTMVQGKADYF